jgi:hypothetical protein
MRKTIDAHRSRERGNGGHRSPVTTKKLTLHRETLRALATAELHRIVGGGEESGTSGRENAC